jgi:LytR cell envelope-related transcriptional attenuator
MTAAMVLLGLSALVLLFSLLNRAVNPTINASVEENPLGLLGDKIKVQLINANGVPNSAKRVRQHLINYGFDVISVRNQTEIEAYSQVLDRTGVINHAQTVAKVLEIPPPRVDSRPKHDELLDVTVVIGQDYKNIKPFKK